MDLFNTNTLIALVVFILVMVAMKIFHKERIKDNPIKFLIYTALYIFFIYAINKYGIEDISLIKWLTLMTILYMTLDDILHREFNLLGALFVIIANFFSEQNYFILCLSAAILITTLFMWLFKKVIKKNSKDTIGGMSSGDPWLIIAFGSFFQFTDIIELLFYTWILIIVGFTILAIRKKAKSGIPLGPIMMLASILTYI